MIDALLKKIEPTIKGWIHEAYKEGYADAQRHMSEMYQWGQEKGYDDALTYLGGVEIPEADGKLEREVFGERRLEREDE